MKYKKYDCNSFSVYTIKTDKFKTAHLEVILRKKAVKEEMGEASFLVDILTQNTKEYKTRRELITKMEELYRPTIYGTTIRTGNILNMNIILDFINPNFIDENNYLEEVIKLFFSIITNPNISDEEFDLKTYNIIKERIRREINSIKENQSKFSIRNALNLLGDTPTTYPLLGTLEELEKITPSSLYKAYKKLLKDYTCDIFVIGNLDMDNLVMLIKKYFKNRYINELNCLMEVKNDVRKSVLTKAQESDNIQANLVMIFNTINLTKKEKDITMQVFNYLYGSGGLTAKLYQSLREKASLCYSVSSMFLKQDNILLVQVSLDNKNVKKAISLIKKDLKAMQSGNFLLEEFEDAKKNMLISLDLASDNNMALLNNYIFDIYDDLPDLEQRKEEYKNLEKKEIMNVAKKIKLNTIYTLNGKGDN